MGTLDSAVTSNGRLYSITWLSTPEYMAWASPDHPHPELWSVNDTNASVVLSRDLADGGYGLCPYAHCNGVPTSAADSTGSLLATGSIDSTIRIWDPSTGEKSITFDGHASHVLSLVWLDTEDQVASGGKDGDISLWDPLNSTSTSALETISAAHAGEVRGLAWMETLSTVPEEVIAGTIAKGPDTLARGAQVRIDLYEATLSELHASCFKVEARSGWHHAGDHQQLLRNECLLSTTLTVFPH